jgi:hypothetical protein
MPCDSMSGASSGDFAWSEVRDLKKVVDELTAVVCEACRIFEADGRPMPPVLAAWWEKHKAYDKSQGR